MYDHPDQFNRLTIDYSQCRHESTWKSGRTKDDQQKWFCPKCGKRWTDGTKDRFARRVQAGKLLVEEGITPYDIEKRGLMCYTAAKKVADLIGPKQRPACPCGKPANHPYGCWFRRQKAAITDCKHDPCRCQRRKETPFSDPAKP